MPNPIAVQGRTICGICKTDKGWCLYVDHPNKGEDIDLIIKDCVRRQNNEVVHKNHKGHIRQLKKTVRVYK